MLNNQVTLAVRYFAATVVFLVPLLVLNVKHGVGAGFLPLVLVGFFVATMSGDRSPLTREEKLLFFAVSILFICATVVTLGVDLNYAGYKRINKFLPLVMVIVRARLRRLDPVLEEAARDLGATPWQAFRRVTLPLLRPAILCAGLMAFTISLDDFVVTFFTAGPGSTTLPLKVFSMVRTGVSPEINALSAILVILSMGLIGVALVFQRK
ncbi:MAG: ABC transporter permease subunit [Proteobacteria bacterium]|nr:ABC transporter permease subunit [Pseudomonadota bacterium]